MSPQIHPSSALLRILSLLSEQSKLTDQKNSIDGIDVLDPCFLPDGWLGFDFRGSNRILLSILGLPQNVFLTRRFFYWVKRGQEPIKLVHRIDAPLTQSIPGKTLFYTSAQELESILLSLINGCQSIAMEYWPKAYIPGMSVIDAGTKELVESRGAVVVPSWNILGPHLAEMSEEQLSSHKKAAEILKDTFQYIWTYIATRQYAGKETTESQIQRLVIDRIHESGAEFNHPPIVACNSHSAIPHFENSPTNDCIINKNSILLIDAWCKLKNSPYSIYADLTDMAFIGEKVPFHLQKVYGIAFEAQSKAIEYISARLQNKQESKSLTGYSVDSIVRSFLKEKGVLGFSLHRTGHNIYNDVHGLSTNLDSFETWDTRLLFERHCYSIEPGLYIPNAYGVRLECNVSLLSNRTLHIEKANSMNSTVLQTICC